MDLFCCSLQHWTCGCQTTLHPKYPIYCLLSCLTFLFLISIWWYNRSMYYIKLTKLQVASGLNLWMVRFENTLICTIFFLFPQIWESIWLDGYCVAGDSQTTDVLIKDSVYITVFKLFCWTCYTAITQKWWTVILLDCYKQWTIFVIFLLPICLSSRA